MKTAMKKRGVTGYFSHSIIYFSLFFLLIVAYPLIFIISSLLQFYRRGNFRTCMALPGRFFTRWIQSVFEYRPIWIGYLNSIFYTLAGTSINVGLTLLAAYPLSRKDLKGRKAIMMAHTFTMLFSGGIIPSYLLVNSLGMVNTRWALLIPNAIVVRNVIITRTFFQSNVSDELLEAAKMDGCSDFRFSARLFCRYPERLLPLFLFLCRGSLEHIFRCPYLSKV